MGGLRWERGGIKDLGLRCNGTNHPLSVPEHAFQDMYQQVFDILWMLSPCLIVSAKLVVGSNNCILIFQTMSTLVLSILKHIIWYERSMFNLAHAVIWWCSFPGTLHFHFHLDLERQLFRYWTYISEINDVLCSNTSSVFANYDYINPP